MLTHVDQVAAVTILIFLAGLIYGAGRQSERLTRAQKDINAIFAAIRRLEAKFDRAQQHESREGKP